MNTPTTPEQTFVYTCLPSQNWDVAGFKFKDGYLTVLESDLAEFENILSNLRKGNRLRITLLSNVAYAKALQNDRFARAQAKAIGPEAVALKQKADDAAKFGTQIATEAMAAEDQALKEIAAETARETNEPISSGVEAEQKPDPVTDNVGGLEESEAAGMQVKVEEVVITPTPGIPNKVETAKTTETTPLNLNTLNLDKSLDN